MLKPWNDEKLLASLGLALRLRDSEAELRRLRSQTRQLASDIDQRLGDMIGESPAMKAVQGLVRKVAATDAAVLITGENGTGKELVARAIHRQSDRREGAFIGVDIASLPEALFESELFGHVKGAFTDAKEGRMGRFESASGGTLFLDEIGNLPLAMQAKLLRAIESGEVAPDRVERTSSRRRPPRLRNEREPARNGREEEVQAGPPLPHQHDRDRLAAPAREEGGHSAPRPSFPRPLLQEIQDVR